MTTCTLSDFDVIIVGAGPVGLTLAGLLARYNTADVFSIALIDAGKSEDAISDPRVIAISQGSRMILELLAWPANAIVIERIHVSQCGSFGRTLIDRTEYGLSALGYVMHYSSIVHTLAKMVRNTPVNWFHSSLALTPIQEHDGIILPVQGTHGVYNLRTRILVSAEGSFYSHCGRKSVDNTLNFAGKKSMHNYDQTALVGMVAVSAPQLHVAWERFTPEGPVALLPMGGVHGFDYALIWCCSPAEAARRTQLREEEFLRELDLIFGGRMGYFTRIDGRVSFPLGVAITDTLVKERIAVVGNAAQTLHPVAGQGLNLGLRDAYVLAYALSRYGAMPLALAAFAQRRVLDRYSTVCITDILARFFTIDVPGLTVLRAIALTALEFVPPLKTALVRQMMFGQRR